jgi:hypothetical protein
MARYVPQHLFDGLVVVRLMADVSGRDDVFNGLVERYRKRYPDDDTTALIADVQAAAAEGPYVVKVVQDAPATSNLSEFEVLRELMEIFAEDAKRGKPRWRTMLQDYFFNVQPTPIQDRVERARDHLIRAEKQLIARAVTRPPAVASA